MSKNVLCVAILALTAVCQGQTPEGSGLFSARRVAKTDHGIQLCDDGMMKCMSINPFSSDGKPEFQIIELASVNGTWVKEWNDGDDLEETYMHMESGIEIGYHTIWRHSSDQSPSGGRKPIAVWSCPNCNSDGPNYPGSPGDDGYQPPFQPPMPSCPEVCGGDTPVCYDGQCVPCPPDDATHECITECGHCQFCGPDGHEGNTDIDCSKCDTDCIKCLGFSICILDFPESPDFPGDGTIPGFPGDGTIPGFPGDGTIPGFPESPDFPDDVSPPPPQVFSKPIINECSQEDMCPGAELLTCTDRLVDNSNCGQCGTMCGPSSPACIGGTCKICNNDDTSPSEELNDCMRICGHCPTCANPEILSSMDVVLDCSSCEDEYCHHCNGYYACFTEDIQELG